MKNQHREKHLLATFGEGNWKLMCLNRKFTSQILYNSEFTVQCQVLRLRKKPQGSVTCSHCLHAGSSSMPPCCPQQSLVTCALLKHLSQDSRLSSSVGMMRRRAYLLYLISVVFTTFQKTCASFPISICIEFAFELKAFLLFLLKSL